MRKERSDTTSTIYPRKDRKSTRLNSSHVRISYAVFCLKKKKKEKVNAEKAVQSFQLHHHPTDGDGRGVCGDDADIHQQRTVALLILALLFHIYAHRPYP